MKVSIILTSYNYGQYITQAIESILSQTHQDFELIIVDDCSTDNSWEIIQFYSDAKIIAYRHERNIGIEANTNFGLSKATSDIICMTCADDWWEATKLEEQLKYINDYDLIFTNVKSDIPIFLEEEILDNINFMARIYTTGNFVCFPSIMIKRKPNDVLSFDVSCVDLSDLKFYVELICKGYKVKKIDKKLINYRWHRNNASNNHSVQKQCRTVKQYTQIFFKMLRDYSDFEKIFGINEALSFEDRKILALSHPPMGGVISEYFKRCI